MQIRLPPAFYAPSRAITSPPSSAVNQRLEIPNLDIDRAILTNIAQNPGESLNQAGNREVVINIFNALKTIAQSLLANDNLFEYIKFILMDPVNFPTFQAIVNDAATSIGCDANTQPGLVTRAEIQRSNVPWIEFDFGEQRLEVQLDGFDLTFLEKNEGAGSWRISLSPTLTIREKDNEDGTHIRISVETNDQANNTIFAETVELIKSTSMVGVNFIRPGEQRQLRDRYLWYS